MNLGIAIHGDHARLALAWQVAAVAARRIDHQERVVDVKEEHVDARHRRIIEERSAITACVASEQNAVPKRAITERELAAQVRTDDVERARDVAAVDEAHARVARTERPED